MRLSVDGAGPMEVTDQVPRLSLLPAEGGHVERCRPVLSGTHGMVLGEAVVALSGQIRPG